MKEIQNVERVIVVHIEDLECDFVVVLTILLVEQRVETFKESVVRNLCAVVSFRHMNIQKLPKEFLLPPRSWAEHLVEVLDKVLFFQIYNCLRKGIPLLKIKLLNILTIFGFLLLALKGSERVKAVEIFVCGI